MDKPFTVIITQSKPPYAPETLLRLHAESEEDAKKVAKEWLASPYTLFVEKKVDEEHYHDDCVDVRTISEFCLTVFTNSDGKTVVVSFDDNLFSPSDLVAAYGKSLEGLGLEPEEREGYVSKYRSYLIACGCEKEELENE